MKYTSIVEIDLPLEQVVKLFDAPANLSKWQPRFISKEHISGTAGQPGAQSKLKYKMGMREIEMIETITKRNLPYEFHDIYETNNVYNIQKNYFKSENGKTKRTSESEFRFSGFMRIIAWLMPGAFRKQSQKYLDLFKAFAEKENANQN